MKHLFALVQTGSTAPEILTVSFRRISLERTKSVLERSNSPHAPFHIMRVSVPTGYEIVEALPVKKEVKP